MDGWNTTFLLNRPIFRGYVSFREGICDLRQGGNFLNHSVLNQVFLGHQVTATRTTAHPGPCTGAVTSKILRSLSSLELLLFFDVFRKSLFLHCSLVLVDLQWKNMVQSGKVPLRITACMPTIHTQIWKMGSTSHLDNHPRIQSSHPLKFECSVQVSLSELLMILILSCSYFRTVGDVAIECDSHKSILHTYVYIWHC